MVIKHNGINTIVKVFVVCIFLCILIFFSACSGGGQAKSVEGMSPELTDYQIWGENDGNENSQRIMVRLGFDQPVTIGAEAADQLRITIGGERQKPENYTVSQEDDTHALLLIKVTYVTDGNLVITSSQAGEPINAITDETGKYALSSINFEHIIPSGVTLETVEQVSGDGSNAAAVTKQVMTSWTHRSITWIQLLDNGVPVVPEGPASTDILDSAVAVHGHDFVWATTKTVAEDIAKVVNTYFGSAYNAEADDDKVKILKLDSSEEGQIDLQIYL